MFTIVTLFKNIVIHLRAGAKWLFALIIGLAIIVFSIFLVYKPMYSVTLDGEFIGYTEDKSDLQTKINKYMEEGSGENVAFVEIESLPEYDMCLMKKDTIDKEDEIFNKVIASGIAYYKYYAIMNNGEEQYYVSTYEECESIINNLKDQDSDNIDDITYTIKYETELKEFTDIDTAVAELYVEKPKPVSKPVSIGSVNTSLNVDYAYASLGSVSLIQPVYGTISSRFGVRSSIRSSAHTGLDIATSRGTPIAAAASGVVSFAGWKGAYGNLIVITHDDGVQTYYGHCNSIYVSSGTYVDQGEIIGEVGSTGNSTGPHLHLEVRIDGVAYNPQNYLY